MPKDIRLIGARRPLPAPPGVLASAAIPPAGAGRPSSADLARAADRRQAFSLSPVPVRCRIAEGVTNDGAGMGLR